jgi:hypothetical protein
MLTYDTDLQRVESYTDVGWEAVHKPRFGGYYISTPASTSLSFNTYAKVGGTTTALNLGADMAHTPNNRVTYSGSKNRVFKFEVTLTATSGSGNKTYEFGIYKNGTTLLAGSCQTVYLSINKDNNTSLLTTHDVAKNDYFELWVKNTDDGTAVTVDKAVLTAVTID